jgi:hypothetical protein
MRKVQIVRVWREAEGSGRSHIPTPVYVPFLVVWGGLLCVNMRFFFQDENLLGMLRARINAMASEGRAPAVACGARPDRTLCYINLESGLPA